MWDERQSRSKGAALSLVCPWAALTSFSGGVLFRGSIERRQGHFLCRKQVKFQGVEFKQMLKSRLNR